MYILLVGWVGLGGLTDIISGALSLLNPPIHRYKDHLIRDAWCGAAVQRVVRVQARIPLSVAGV